MIPVTLALGFLAQGNPGIIFFPICELIGFSSLIVGICFTVVWTRRRTTVPSRKSFGVGLTAIVLFVVFGLCAPLIFPWGHWTRTYKVFVVDAATKRPITVDIFEIEPDDQTDLDDPFLVDSKTIREPNEVDATINVEAAMTLKCKGYEKKTVQLNASTPNPLTVLLVRSDPDTTQSTQPAGGR